MKPLETDYAVGWEGVEGLIEGFKVKRRDDVDGGRIRDSLRDAGYGFKTVIPNPKPARFLAADCSISFRETRYNAIWAAHAVAVYACFDAKEHRDIVVGNGFTRYTDLRYSSYVKAGEILPYSDADVRGNLARMAFEFSSLGKAYEELGDASKPDYILVDGSIYTNKRNLEDHKTEHPEGKEAHEAFEKALSLGKTIGLVEDSHATDLSRELGYGFTNLLLFDAALGDGEYVVDKRDGVNVCYLKLPPKPLPFFPSGMSQPLTVRWEFPWEGFDKALDALAGIWMEEDDIHHPQLYPVRIADHLTRRVKTSGILEGIANANRLLPRYRDLRNG